mmetsp:Transcript_10728/g.28495  ORF Transcript_10728/g.28495 Transcript_10728/m.28495 type:complete len:254 (-) Transcript_10728:65-826(-)
MPDEVPVRSGVSAHADRERPHPEVVEDGRGVAELERPLDHLPRARARVGWRRLVLPEVALHRLEGPLGVRPRVGRGRFGRPDADHGLQPSGAQPRHARVHDLPEHLLALLERPYGHHVGCLLRVGVAATVRLHRVQGAVLVRGALRGVVLAGHPAGLAGGGEDDELEGARVEDPCDRLPAHAEVGDVLHVAHVLHDLPPAVREGVQRWRRRLPRGVLRRRLRESPSGVGAECHKGRRQTPRGAWRTSPNHHGP